MFINTISTWLDQLKTYRQSCHEELCDLPEGNLTCYHCKDGHLRYSLDTYDGYGKRHCQGVSKNIPVRNQLARKGYLTKLIKALDKDIAELERLSKRWVSCRPEDVISQLPKAYRDLPTEAFFDQQKAQLPKGLANDLRKRIHAHEAWGAQEYDQSTMFPESLTNTTTFGLKVRSKAESLIAEQLHRYGIPFRYEQKLYLSGQLFVPDFTFEGANSKEFYLEFCGMMNDSEYVRRHYEKRAFYENAGIVPWRNIIYIYACDNILDMQVVDAEIRSKVMAWL